jgi:hypothetical protein
MREHVARTAQGIVGLLQPELSDVPRDGRLRDDTAGAGERVQELELRPDPLPGDDAFDQPMRSGLPSCISPAYVCRFGGAQAW